MPFRFGQPSASALFRVTAFAVAAVFRSYAVAPTAIFGFM
jgi:hypothetical protein